MRPLWRRLADLFRRFFDPRLPFLFIIGAVMLELLGNAFYDLLKNYVRAPVSIVILVIISLPFFIFAYDLVKRLVRRVQPRVIMNIPREPAPRREGLIVIVSYGPLESIPATAAIRYHYQGERDELPQPVLRYCWLVASTAPAVEAPGKDAETKEAFTSAANATRLEAQYRGKLKLIKTEPIQDMDDPRQVFWTIEDIYRQARQEWGLEEKQIIADFTGGTKSMTAGMVLACTSPHRDLQFMKPRRYLPDGRADPQAGSEPQLVNVDFFWRLKESQD